MVAWGEGGGQEGTGVNKWTLLRKVGLSIILTVVIVSLVNIHVEGYQVIHFKFVQFIVCKLYHNKAVKIFSKNYK